MANYRLIVGFIVLTTLGVLYDKYKVKETHADEKRNDELISQYILNQDDSDVRGSVKVKSTKKNKKPYLWLHNKYNRNQRNGSSFRDRTTMDLNQSYLELCIESIVHHCGDSFNVCLITDDSFSRLLFDWNLELDDMPEPIKSHYRELAMLKLIHQYGGMTVPTSTLMFKNIYPIYNRSLAEKDMFCGEYKNETVTADYERMLPSVKFMGGKRYSKPLERLVGELEVVLSQDYTSEHAVVGKMTQLLMDCHIKGNLKVVTGDFIGTRDPEGKLITIEQLFSDKFLQLSEMAYSLYIPAEEILTRSQYEWFARLSERQIFESSNFISRILLMVKGDIVGTMKQSDDVFGGLRCH